MAPEFSTNRNEVRIQSRELSRHGPTRRNHDLVTTFLRPPLVNEIIDEDEDGGFETSGQALHFYREFFGLWNELAEYQSKVFPLQIVDLGAMSGESPDTINSLRMFWLKLHLLSFDKGFTLANGNTVRFAGTFIGDFIAFIEDKIIEMDKLENARQFSTPVVDKLVSEIESFWNENYLRFAQDCQDARLREIERMKLIETHKHIGRNEPCPCGSGKKFKKCCLEMH